jgi:hypothetical protein
MLNAQIIYCILYFCFHVSFNIMMGHLICHQVILLFFLEGPWPSINGLIYCLCIFGMFGSNCFCTYHLFPIGWSFFFQWSDTWRNQHFSLPFGTTPSCLFSCPPLLESYGTIVSSLASFFNKLPMWRVFHIFRCSLGHHMGNSSILCKSIHERLVISPSYHIYILFVIGLLLYNVMYPYWLATSYSCTFFMLLVWTYHWWFKCPFVLVHVQEWAHYSPRYSSRYHCNYYFEKLGSLTKRDFPPFPITFGGELIFLSA